MRAVTSEPFVSAFIAQTVWWRAARDPIVEFAGDQRLFDNQSLSGYATTQPVRGTSSIRHLSEIPSRRHHVQIWLADREHFSAEPSKILSHPDTVGYGFPQERDSSRWDGRQ